MVTGWAFGSSLFARHFTQYIDAINFLSPPYQLHLASNMQNVNLLTRLCQEAKMWIIMVFNFDLATLLIGILFLWILVLTFFLWQTAAHYNKLTRGTGRQTLKDVLEKILQDIGVSRDNTQELVSRCDKIEQDAVSHAQKIGLVRFNPFKDTGGDQSFVLALLDGRDNGIVISSLHGRTGTRWFAKSVASGKGREHELSDEEQEAVKKAQQEQKHE